MSRRNSPQAKARRREARRQRAAAESRYMLAAYEAMSPGPCGYPGCTSTGTAHLRVTAAKVPAGLATFRQGVPPAVPKPGQAFIDVCDQHGPVLARQLEPVPDALVGILGGQGVTLPGVEIDVPTPAWVLDWAGG